LSVPVGVDVVWWRGASLPGLGAGVGRRDGVELVSLPFEWWNGRLAWDSPERLTGGGGIDVVVDVNMDSICASVSVSVTVAIIATTVVVVVAEEGHGSEDGLGLLSGPHGALEGLSGRGGGEDGLLGAWALCWLAAAVCVCEPESFHVHDRRSR
jgi:hypothetical protein